MDERNQPIIVEQSFNTSIEDVWKAITELDQMKQWFFEDIESFRPEVGFETHFNVQSGGRDFMHLWKLTEVVANKKIVYSWKYRDYPGDFIVTFELFEHENQTMLRLTAEVKESFPKGIPEFKRESGVAGWEYFIGKSLKEYLKKDIEPWL